MKIAIMGCGTVGYGVFRIFQHCAASLQRGSRGEEVGVKYVLDIREFDDREITAMQVRDINIIANDPEVGLVVETMGGLHPAFEFCMKCLEKGKSVVTSNKLLVAEKGVELFDAAKAHNAAFRFGAAVCGGIPVIRTLFYGLAANRLDGFIGILNGTSNFVLTKMFRDKMSYEDALKLAQEKGYAEKDPTDDIEGYDAARKTAILCSVCFGSHIKPDQIHTEGISKITAADAAYVGGINKKIKLLGFGGRVSENTVTAGVSPALVQCGDPLADADGVMNGVKLFGSQVGEVMLFGPGAGREATASAVAADVLDCVRCPGFDPAYYWGPGEGVCVTYLEDDYLSFYVRGYAKDRAEAVRRLRAEFPSAEFLTRENAPENEIAFLTDVNHVQRHMDSLAFLEGVFEPAIKIRIYS